MLEISAGGGLEGITCVTSRTDDQTPQARSAKSRQARSKLPAVKKGKADSTLAMSRQPRRRMQFRRVSRGVEWGE
jgi:hypothetical protein